MLIRIKTLYYSLVQFIFLYLLAGTLSAAVDKDSAVIRSIYSEALTSRIAYHNLVLLCRKAPGRLSGSPQLNTAIQLTKQFLQEAGADTVYLQPVQIPNWKPGYTEAIVAAGNWKVHLHALPLGNSVPTPAEGITASVVEVHSFDELNALGREKVSGRIVFYNRPMDPTLINTFAAYGKAVDQRVAGASKAAALGAVAVLVRSLTLACDTFPHTGQLRYQEGITKIPALAIATCDADSLSLWLKQNTDLQTFIKTSCRPAGDTVGYNVIGEIRGKKPAEGIMVAGGHLDAWYNSPGAHDDGAGCIQAIEVIRLFHSLGIRPVHTIRAVLFMDEEITQTGGKKYAQVASAEKENHLIAIESDRGGLLPIGFTFDCNEKDLEILQKLKSYFEPYRTDLFIKGGSGTDVAPLRSSARILAGLLTDSQRYFDYHHSANDTPKHVNQRELQLGSAAIASLFYLMDRRF